MSQIRTLIVQGNLKPGDRLPTERELSKRFGVGRSSVREAMMALAATGSVIRSREGTFVNPNPSVAVWSALDRAELLTKGTARDVFETRRLFEVGIVALAAERATDEAIAEIQNWCPDHVANVEEFINVDVQFHSSLAQATGNSFLHMLYARMQEFLFQTHQYYAALEQVSPSVTARMYDEVLEQHKVIMEAVRDRDAEAAKAAMVAHFAGLEGRMLVEQNDG